MSGIEILISVLGTALTGVVIWLLQKLGSMVGIKKDSELYELIEKYVEKAIDNYEDDFTKLVEEKGKELVEDQEFLGEVLGYLNRNAPKLIKKFFGTNQEQLEEFVKSYLIKLINKIG